MIFLRPAIASGVDVEEWRGSTACSLSVLWLDTQFGDGGQGASLPSITPRFSGRPPVQPMMSMLAGNIMARDFISMSRIGEDQCSIITRCSMKFRIAAGAYYQTCYIFRIPVHTPPLSPEQK